MVAERFQTEMSEMQSRVRELASLRSSRESRRHTVIDSGEVQVPSTTGRSRDIPEARRNSEDLRLMELRCDLALAQSRLAAQEEAAQAEE
eukprot:9411892-Alexandrium_andersonii.AAC.1